MARYSEEVKSSSISRMMSGESVSNITEKLGVSSKTLYKWRKDALKQGYSMSNKTNKSDNWSAEQKLAIIIETASMNESELSSFCRVKGIYPEQIKQWRQMALSGYKKQTEINQTQSDNRKEDRKKIKDLEGQLRRKEKALAETASLLVLSKKCQATWGEDEED